MEFLENSPAVLCKLISAHHISGTQFSDFDGTTYDPVTASLLAIEHFKKNDEKALALESLAAILPSIESFNPNFALKGSTLNAYAILAKALPNYAITSFSADELAAKILLEWQRSQPFDGPRNNNPAYLLARSGNYNIVNDLIQAGLETDAQLLTRSVISSIPTKAITKGMTKAMADDFVEFAMGELSKLCLNLHIDANLPVNGKNMFDILLEEGHFALHQSLLSGVLQRKIEQSAVEHRAALAAIQATQPDIAAKLRVNRHL
ncbi:hypothetical protein D3C80_128110 [compost metagenome]